MALCGKCKVAPPHTGNKWCLGCLAWEVIEKELGAPWPSPAHRAVGEDLVLTCGRALHRIRHLGAADPPAPAVTHQVEAAPAPAAPLTTGAERAVCAERRKGVEEEGEYSYYSTSEEERKYTHLETFPLVRYAPHFLADLEYPWNIIRVVSGFFCTTSEVKMMNGGSDGVDMEGGVSIGGVPAVPLARPVAEGEEYSWEDLESWAQLAPNSGDVLELLVEGAEFGDGTVAAILVDTITTEPSGGLVVTGKSLGASTPAVRDTLSNTVNRRKEPIHLCPAGPAVCESTGVFALHVGNIKWWRPELFMADYLTSGGRKALQGAVKSRTDVGKLELEARGRAAVASELPPADGAAPHSEGLHGTLDRLNGRLRAGFPTADGGMPLPGGTMDGGLSGGALVNSGSVARVSGPTLASAAHLGSHPEAGRKEKRKKKKKKRGKKRKRSTSSSSDSSSSYSSDSREVLEAPIARRARKDPGSVLGMLLRRVQEEMDMVGAAGATGASNTTVLDASRLTAYLQQIVKPRSGQGWTRDLRECLMLAVSLDFMRKGKLPEAMDVLAARFMAIEQSMTDGNWTTASQIEIATPEQFGAIMPGVLLATRRHVSKVHKAQGEKGKGKATWGSYGDRAPWKGGKKGDAKGEKGGGKQGGKRDGAEKGVDDRKREDGRKR
ncbi:unnamed protein product [Symbiodinium sp. CCMP2592]|nr:unnamed protein product [Symbiodinium sp. CCMP2592]